MHYLNIYAYSLPYMLHLYLFNSFYVLFYLFFPFIGLPRDHPESYHSFMWNNFFKHIDIHPENVHLLDGNAKDLVKECDSYEKKIKEAGGIDLFMGGL